MNGVECRLSTAEEKIIALQVGRNYPEQSTREQMRKYLCLVPSLTYRCRNLISVCFFPFPLSSTKKYFLFQETFYDLSDLTSVTLFCRIFLASLYLCIPIDRNSFISWDPWMQELKSYPKPCPLVESVLSVNPSFLFAMMMYEHEDFLITVSVPRTRGLLDSRIWSVSRTHSPIRDGLRQEPTENCCKCFQVQGQQGTCTGSPKLSSSSTPSGLMWFWRFSWAKQVSGRGQ